MWGLRECVCVCACVCVWVCVRISARGVTYIDEMKNGEIWWLINTSTCACRA